jgi:hypothetical protein
MDVEFDGVKAVRDQAAIRYEITRVASIIRRTNLRAVAAAEPAKDSHCGGMSTGHLYYESTFNFIPWFCALDKGQARV